MSDAKLRELERRWKETGAVEDEAAYLLERVRVGDLEPERLELAAFFGHKAAQHISPIRPPSVGLRDWLPQARERTGDGLLYCIALARLAVRFTPSLLDLKVLAAELERAERYQRGELRLTDWADVPFMPHAGWLDDIASDEEWEALGETGRAVLDVVFACRQYVAGHHLDPWNDVDHALSRCTEIAGEQLVLLSLQQALADFALSGT